MSQNKTPCFRLWSTFVIVSKSFKKWILHNTPFEILHKSNKYIYVKVYYKSSLMCFKHCVKHEPLDLEKHLKSIERVVFLNHPGQSSNTVSPEISIDYISVLNAVIPLCNHHWLHNRQVVVMFGLLLSSPVIPRCFRSASHHISRLGSVDSGPLQTPQQEVPLSRLCFCFLPFSL